jgi:hypothetical protein
VERIVLAAVLYQWASPYGMRIKDIDFEKMQITVRSGEDQDRVTILPSQLVSPLRRHCNSVQTIHKRDLEEGWGCVALPHALERKYPAATREWTWQWVFPQSKRWRDPRRKQQGRHHMDPSLIQRAVKQAVRDA